jgi:protein translocase SecG subunit
MYRFLTILQILSAILVIVLVLLQNIGGGLGGDVFGMSGGGSGSYRTKRGMERVFFYSTIIFAIILFGSVFAKLILDKTA